MKKNSGSALTSVIVVFLLVTMIGVPLLSMVVYNYQLREYDSGTKEAEYKNEVVMDRIATIIKNSVIEAISLAKDSSTNEISAITDILVNSYNIAYDDAYDDVVAQKATYDADGKINNKTDINTEVEVVIKDTLKEQLSEKVSSDRIVEESLEILDFKGDISNAQINDEKLQSVCNSIFQEKYKNILLKGTEENGYTDIFKEIYKVKCDDIADNIAKGEQPIATAEGKTLESSIRIRSKYTPAGVGNLDYIYQTTGYQQGISAKFDETTNTLEIGVENNYRLNARVPVTTLSATFVIGVPEFSAISAIEQQTIALSNPVLDYGVIVGKTLQLKGNVMVDGNVLALANGIETKIVDDEVTVVNDKGIVINSGAKFSLSRLKEGETLPSDGRIATSGDIIMDNNTELNTGTNPIYYRNLYLGDPNNKKTSGKIDVNFNGDVLAKDDLEINLDGSGIVNVWQDTNKTYFGYNDKNEGGPDSSSAIVVNSSALNGISIELGNLYLAGRAFIEGVESVNLLDDKDNKMIYKTGESISIKGNYSAYQTPLFGTGKYDVLNVQFSPYFMASKKEELDTNVAINLVDLFAVPADGDYSAGPITKEDLEASNFNTIKKNKYSAFDKIHKKEYFKLFATQNSSSIKKPKKIEIGNVEYMTGAGIADGKGVFLVAEDNKKYAIMTAKGARFEEFTECFGYYPEDAEKRGENIADWISFGDADKIVKEGNLFFYISAKDANNKIERITWKSDDNNAGTSELNILEKSISLEVDDEVRGIIIHDGDLTITDSDIPFYGMIIVTGNLTIEGDLKVFSTKEETSTIIIENYLGSDFIYSNDVTPETPPNNSAPNSTELKEGDLFNSFEYDGSGTTYVAIDVTPRSNMIDINKLVGIKDWKKQGYGRL